MKRILSLGLILTGALLIGVSSGQEKRFAELVGKVAVGDVKDMGTLEVPFLSWGGDVGFFVANGGLETKKGSTYDRLGLKLQFVNGDDFPKQVQRYLAGKTPFLRGTSHMIGLASEVCGSDPRTQPIVLVQMTWSEGDHIVARKEVRTLNDLKRAGKKVKIAVQQGGPHVGLIFDALQAAKIQRDDVEILFTTDISGPNGPAALFRKDESIDCCCVITPDMLGLVGGVGSKGTGEKDSVKDAHVLVSTQSMSRSIADVLCVRKDWFEKNKETCEKLVAGYLQGCTQVVTLRKTFAPEKGNKLSPEYRAVLQQSQDIFGKDFLPTLEDDAHGLLLDATFVGLPGNISFFEDKGNQSGFDKRMTAALDLATSWGYAKSRHAFLAPGFDYKKIAELGGIKFEVPKTLGVYDPKEIYQYRPSQIDERTLLSFDIQFKANQEEFSVAAYGADFERAVATASTFGKAVVVIRGHSDPTKTLVDLIQAGMDKGIITRQGAPGSYRYSLNGQPLDASRTGELVRLIREGTFYGGTKGSPRDTMQAALNLSHARAESVKQALVLYAQSKQKNLNISQIVPTGVGISQPIIARPRSAAEAERNMRVEFRIVRVDNVIDVDF